MKAKIDDDDDFEWDKRRLLALLICFVIAASGILTLIRLYQPPTIVSNVAYNMKTDRDPATVNSLYNDFWSGGIGENNISLVTVYLMIGEIPDVNRLAISISTDGGLHLTAIVLSNFVGGDVLHAFNYIPEEQHTYSLTVNGGGLDLSLYLFFTNATIGSYSLNVRTFIASG